jgi:tetratricopeptide (TPR) repeat protein
VPSSDPPQSDREPNVTSLVDRLPPALRAKLLARLALEPHVSGREQLAQFGDYASHIESIDLDTRLAELENAPPDFPGVREVKNGCRAIRGMRSFLRNEPDAALAEWAAIIAEDPEGAASAHFFRCQFHLVRGELEEALSDVNRALVLAPQDAPTYARRGEIYHHMNRDAEAVANFLRAAQLNPDNLSALSGLGVCRFAEGDWADAIRWYTRAIRIAPTRSQLLLGRALSFENENRNEEALTDFDAVIALAPDDAAAFHGRGRCRKATSRDLAIADFTRSIELDASESSVWNDRARVRLLAGALDEAESDATRAIELDPTEARAHFTRGLIHHRRGNVARAIVDYQAAARIEPTELLYVTACTKAHMQLGDGAGVRGDLDATIALEPTAVEFRVLRARLLVDEEEAFERALEDFDVALSLGGGIGGSAPVFTEAGRAELHHERAAVLRSLDRNEEAAEDEERACVIAPDVAKYRSWLGLLRSKIERQAHLAEGDLTRAIELAPQDPVIRFQRAVYYEFVQRWDDAIADHTRTIELAPDEAPFHFRRGAARWQASDDDEGMRAAIADYDRAIEIDGDEPEVLRWRADAHTHFGDHRAALADLDRALVLEPESGEALYLRHACKGELGDAIGAQEDLLRAGELGWPEAVEQLASRGG